MYPVPTPQGPNRGTGLIIAGVVLAPLGVLGLGFESSNHSVCNSSLGVVVPAGESAQGVCAAANIIFYLAVLLLVVGIAMAIIGLVLHARTGTPGGFYNAGMSPGRQAAPPPGWYSSPEHPEFVRWWSGTQWTGREYPATQPPPSPLPPPPVPET
jgi:hypothetical protein